MSQETVYNLQISESDFKLLTQLAVAASVDQPVPMLPATESPDKVYSLRVSSSYYKTMIELVCNAKLDGSLLASLLEQKEMQDAEATNKPTPLYPDDKPEPMDAFGDTL